MRLETLKSWMKDCKMKCTLVLFSPYSLHHSYQRITRTQLWNYDLFAHWSTDNVTLVAGTFLSGQKKQHPSVSLQRSNPLWHQNVIQSLTCNKFAWEVWRWWGSDMQSKWRSAEWSKLHSCLPGFSIYVNEVMLILTVTQRSFVISSCCYWKVKQHGKI